MEPLGRAETRALQQDGQLQKQVAKQLEVKKGILWAPCLLSSVSRPLVTKWQVQINAGKYK